MKFAPDIFGPAMERVRESWEIRRGLFGFCLSRRFSPELVDSDNWLSPKNERRTIYQRGVSLTPQLVCSLRLKSSNTTNCRRDRVSNAQRANGKMSKIGDSRRTNSNCHRSFNWQSAAFVIDPDVLKIRFFSTFIEI
jgi:hypothetical protein